MRLGAIHARTRNIAADERGGVAIMFAAATPMIIACLALCIDVIGFYNQKRRAQGAVDIAALTAVDYLGKEDEAARAILQDNGLLSAAQVETGQLYADNRGVDTTNQYDVVAGRYTPDKAIEIEKRFVAGASPENAVAVTVRSPAQLYFSARFIKPPEIEVRAVAARRALASFSVGSRLASVNEGAVNALLTAATGSNVNLTALDYNSLLNADISVVSFLNGLASELNITSGTYADVLDSEPTFSEFLAAVETASGSGPAFAALRSLEGMIGGTAGRISLTRTLDLGALADAKIGDAGAQGFPARVSALELVSSNLVLANGTNLLKMDLAAAAPGLASLSARLVVGEGLQTAPWFSIGEKGDTVSNTQIRLALDATIGGSGVLAGTKVRLPTYFEVAKAEGTLKNVQCDRSDPNGGSVILTGQSSALKAYVGDANFSAAPGSNGVVNQAKIVSTPGIAVFASAEMAVAQSAPEQLKFTSDDIKNGTIKSTYATTALSSVISSLLKNTKIEANALGLGVSTSLVTPAVGFALSDMSAPVDDAALSILAALGVRVGEGDYRVTGVECRRPVLVR